MKWIIEVYEYMIHLDSRKMQKIYIEKKNEKNFSNLYLEIVNNVYTDSLDCKTWLYIYFSKS